MPASVVISRGLAKSIQADGAGASAGEFAIKLRQRNLTLLVRVASEEIAAPGVEAPGA